MGVKYVGERIMLTKNFYDDLQAISQLPNEGYEEDKCPAFLSWNHERYLLKREYLEYHTLVPPGKEEAYPVGYRMVVVSPLGYYALEQYAEQKAKEKRETVQFAVTAILAVLALPGVTNGLITLFK